MPAPSRGSGLARPAPAVAGIAACFNGVQAARRAPGRPDHRLAAARCRLKRLRRRAQHDFIDIHVGRLLDRIRDGARHGIGGNGLLVKLLQAGRAFHVGAAARQFRGARWRAVASPRPLLAPVMSTTFPAIF